MSDLELALVGNCGIAALLDARARLVWACLPRFDGDPFFSALLANGGGAERGFFAIELEGFERAEQSYLENTAIVVTRLHGGNGAVVEITDFAPRFSLFGRSFHPIALVRQVRPLRGAPRISVRMRPTHGWGAHRPETTRGSHHLRYVTPSLTMRLTTDAPISYLEDETPFLVDEPLTLYLGPDETLDRAVADLGRDFFERTRAHWLEWSRSLAIPFEWQEAVIRAAITIKLSSFEETGAIVAAVTTSLPEAPGSGRNWDYRFCWLRDAYFVVRAANRVGATHIMERYLRYILDVAAHSPDGYLQPVYGITREARLEEGVVASLPGYRGMGPVRVGNAAFEQVQNDSYGSVINAVTQSFFDQRLSHRGTVETFRRLELLGEQAAHRYDQPDAGVWEYRSRASVHTYSSVMCWVACDRLRRIAARLGLGERADYWGRHAARIRAYIEQAAWSDRLRRFRSTIGGNGDDDAADASLLLLHDIGFLSADDPRFAATVEEIGRTLSQDGLILRYRADELGDAATAFTVCTFWYIDALRALGRTAEARELFETMLTKRNRLGLLSEDLDLATGELWGNFPQTYSMVGLINSAIRLSRSWEEAF